MPRTHISMAHLKMRLTSEGSWAPAVASCSGTCSTSGVSTLRGRDTWAGPLRSQMVSDIPAVCQRCHKPVDKVPHATWRNSIICLQSCAGIAPADWFRLCVQDACSKLLQGWGVLQAKLRKVPALVPGKPWPADRTQCSCGGEGAAVHQAAGLSRQATNSIATVRILRREVRLIMPSFAALVWCLLGLLCLQRRQPPGLQGLYA